MQQVEALGLKFTADKQAVAGGVASWPVKACHQPEFHRVVAEGKDDGYYGRRSLRRQRRWVAAGRDDHSHLSSDEIGSKARQTFVSAVGPAILDRGVSANDNTRLAQAAVKRAEHVRGIAKPPAAEETNHRHRRLLRTCRERPCGRATKQRDELAS